MRIVATARYIDTDMQKTLKEIQPNQTYHHLPPTCITPPPQSAKIFRTPPTVPLQSRYVSTQHNVCDTPTPQPYAYSMMRAEIPSGDPDYSSLPCSLPGIRTTLGREFGMAQPEMRDIDLPPQILPYLDVRDLDSWSNRPINHSKWRM
jgi:hypothetical protein